MDKSKIEAAKECISLLLDTSQLNRTEGFWVDIVPTVSLGKKGDDIAKAYDVRDALQTALTVLSEYRELQKENKELFKRLDEVVKLGVTQADEYDRFWNAMGCMSKDITIDEAIKKYKDLQAQLESANHDKQAVEDALEQAGLELHQLKLDYTNLEAQLEEMKKALTGYKMPQQIIDKDKEITELKDMIEKGAVQVEEAEKQRDDFKQALDRLAEEER